MRIESLTCALGGFPGDPPLADLSATYGLLILLATLAVRTTILRPRGREASQWMASAVARRRVSSGILALAIAGCLLGFGGLVPRHLGRWRAVQEALLEEVARIEKEHQGAGELSLVEYVVIDSRLQSSPRRFVLTECGDSARIRVMQTTSPYVGLDFGDGRNAVFEPHSMVAIYTD